MHWIPIPPLKCGERDACSEPLFAETAFVSLAGRRAAKGFPMISSPSHEALTDTLMFKISRKPTSVIGGELRITELEIGPLGHDDKQYLHPVI